MFLLVLALPIATPVIRRGRKKAKIGRKQQNLILMVEESAQFRKKYYTQVFCTNLESRQQ